MRRFAEFLGRVRRGGSERDRARLAAILELNRALAEAEDRRALLTTLVDEAVRLFGAERGFLAVPADRDPGYRIDVARSLDREAVRSPERKVSATILGKAFGEAEGVFSEDAREGSLSAVASIADLKLRSVLCTPLLVGARVVGCLYLDHRFQAGAFSAEDLPWVQAFADQAAIALHLHSLLAENRERGRVIAEQNERLQHEVAAQAAELAELQDEVGREALRGDFDDFVGSAPALCRSLLLLDRVAPRDLPVLVVGESGTGKELAARGLHRNGRPEGPFVAVNVAAIAPALLESELFGHVRGAFTGADRDRVGLVREADGGVLFLDEVTEMELDVQVKLLRFLEQREVRPVGGEEVQAVDVRLVAATNRDPLEAVQKGRFREDLYYRLAAVTVELPPLRRRRSDIPELARAFLADAAAERGGAPAVLTDELLTALAARPWPGNVRQLRNEMRRLDALADGGPLSPAMLSAGEPTAVERGDGPPADTLDLAALERWAIARALEEAGGNKAEAARRLGISRRSLYNKLGNEG